MPRSTPSPEIPPPPSSSKQTLYSRQPAAATKRPAEDQDTKPGPSKVKHGLPTPPLVSSSAGLLNGNHVLGRYSCGFPGLGGCNFRCDHADVVLDHIQRQHWSPVRIAQSLSSSFLPADFSMTPAGLLNGNFHQYRDLSSSPASGDSVQNGFNRILSYGSTPHGGSVSVPPILPRSNLPMVSAMNVNSMPTIIMCPISPCKEGYRNPQDLINHINQNHLSGENGASTSKGNDRTRPRAPSPDIPVIAPRARMSFPVSPQRSVSDYHQGQREDRENAHSRSETGSDIFIMDDHDELGGSKRSHRGSVISQNGASSHRRERASYERDPTFHLSTNGEKNKRLAREERPFFVDRQLRPKGNFEKPKGPTQQQRLLARIQKVITGETNRNILDDSDDSNSNGFSNEPFAQLRSLASVLSAQAREIPYEEPDESEEQVKRLTGDRSEDGYEAVYQRRLQDNLGPSDEACNALISVSDLIRHMVESGGEYQEAGEGMLELIVAAASNGKTVPNLRMVSYSGFYGKDLGDAGWGCGYRNAQMLFAALLKWPVTRDTLINGINTNKVPNIPRLQELLSEAWDQGFDSYSAGELQNLVIKTSKWIGTVEVQTLFSSLRIDSRIADFCSAPGTTDCKEQLFTFLLDYFTFHSSTGSKFIPPIYIQYAGHSRTVIGMDVTGFPQNPAHLLNLDKKERDKWMDKVGLLIFDPGASQWDMAQPEKPTRKWYFDKIHCKLSSFKEETYQILYFTGRILDDLHYEQMKIVGAGHHAGSFFLDE